jgi:hypothetical protein
VHQPLVLTANSKPPWHGSKRVFGEAEAVEGGRSEILIGSRKLRTEKLVEQAATDIWTWSTWLLIIISIIGTAIAIAAAVIAYVAPQSAARLAENLRVQNTTLDKQRHMKEFIFLTLMQERAAPYTLEAVRMFNGIDVVFNDNELVREAWSQYYSSLDEKNAVSFHLRTQYFVHLLKLISEDIGFKGLRLDDLNRVYYPTYLAKRMNIETMQQTLQEADLHRMLSQNETNAANTTSQTVG